MANKPSVDSCEFAGPALVIEDDALIALELCESLAKMGFGPIDVARTPAESLSRAEEANYAVAIVDIKLDSGDALDAARRLKLKGSPFLFASGYMLRLPADLAGIPFLAKPFSEAALNAAIRAAVNGRGAAP